jgi:hypothetical protein
MLFFMASDTGSGFFGHAPFNAERFFFGGIPIFLSQYDA